MIFVILVWKRVSEAMFSPSVSSIYKARVSVQRVTASLYIVTTIRRN